MKIIMNEIPATTIELFAEKHGLTMVINERRQHVDSSMRYYAKFEHSEVRGNGVLIGAYGNGQTPSEAIENYAKEIDLKTLVFSAMGVNRKEIEVPRLVFK